MIETLGEFAARTKFAYLAGIIQGEARDHLRVMYENWHKDHGGARYDACALCEVDAAMAALSGNHPLLAACRIKGRAKRFRNTGRKHKR